MGETNKKKKRIVHTTALAAASAAAFGECVEKLILDKAHRRPYNNELLDLMIYRMYTLFLFVREMFFFSLRFVFTLNLNVTFACNQFLSRQAYQRTSYNRI